MARTARKKSVSGYYHIVLRGINKQNIFYDDEDKQVFLSRLKIIKEERKEYKLIGFCLMTNHVHLLIKEGNLSIGIIMRRVLSSYVFWYNSKYERIGNLFQDRFRSEPINDDKYLLSCLRYILQNPLKAKMSKTIWEYKWSSASLFLTQKDSFVNKEVIEKIIPNKTDLINFLETKEYEAFLEWESTIKLTDEKLKEKIINKLKIDNVYGIMKKEKAERDEILKKIMNIEGVTALQVSRITGVPYHFIRYLE